MNLVDIEQLLKEYIGVEVSLERILNKINFDSLEVNPDNYRIISGKFDDNIYEAIKSELDAIYQEKLNDVKRRQFVTQFYEKLLSLAGHNETEKTNRIKEYNEETNSIYTKLDGLNNFIGLIENKIEQRKPALK